jgi:hypothetical protein
VRTREKRIRRREEGGGVWGCGGGNAGRARSACRTLKEEEAGLLYPEVRNHSSRHPVLESAGI